MKIFELFNNTLPYKWIDSEENYGSAEFTVGEYRYGVVFEKIEAEYHLPERWTISFVQISTDKRGYESTSIDMTGTGHEFEVMSTVRAITVDWFKTHLANCIEFTANNRRRQSLYARMFKQIFPNWEIEKSGNRMIAYRN
jgi:hypothetical protein